MKDNISVRPCPDGIIDNNRGKHLLIYPLHRHSCGVYTCLHHTHLCTYTLTTILLVLLFLQHKDTLPHMKQRLHKISYTPDRMNEQVNTYLI